LSNHYNHSNFGQWLYAVYYACARRRGSLAHSRFGYDNKEQKMPCAYQQVFLISWRIDRLWKPPRFPFGAYRLLLLGGKAADSIPSQVKTEPSSTFVTPYSFIACIKETFASSAWEQNRASPAPCRHFSV
jgi:hypothetical protein